MNYYPATKVARLLQILGPLIETGEGMCVEPHPEGKWQATHPKDPLCLAVGDRRDESDVDDGITQDEMREAARLWRELSNYNPLSNKGSAE